MSSFQKLLPFDALRPEQFGQVICPKLAYLSIMDLRDDPDALDGGEDALRALCDAQGREWEWDEWDNNERTELVEELWNLIDHGVYVVRQATSFPPALPAFHQVDGQWQVTDEVRQMSRAHDRFAHTLAALRQREQELKE